MRSCPQCISPRLSRQICSSIAAPRLPTASFRETTTTTTTTTSSRSRKFFTSSSSLLRSSHNSEPSRSTSSAGTSSSSSSSHGAASPGSDDAVASAAPATSTSTNTNTGNTNTNTNSTRKRKASRKTTTKNSLRRVAIIAQQPKRTDADHHLPGSADESGKDESANVVSAICMAEGFHMNTVVDTLSAHGFQINPDGTEFDAHEVVHARAVNGGDIFVFPSGTLVTWSLPLDVVSRQMLPAAQDLHAPHCREVESLDFSTDDGRETSVLRGDAIVLGTRREHRHADRLDTTLAKIAFSSGLARSTKLAVLESALTAYFESTRRVPALLSRGGAAGAGFGIGVPLSRRFILKKTGELLSLRARLNHYSELTDALPDIFWDSRSELGLEGYYEQVGRALDVNVRIRALNQKMDYAQEIATVLRELSSEQHGTRLEWIIILLIAVEVVFEMRHIVREWRQKQETTTTTTTTSPAQVE